MLWKAHRNHTSFLWTLTFVFAAQLIWPLLRCLGNLLVSGGDVMPEDTRLLAALCVFSQTYLHLHPALSRESLWALNNLTGEQDISTHLLKMISISINSEVKLKLKWTFFYNYDCDLYNFICFSVGSSGFCSGLLLLNMVPILIQFLSFSKGINTMVRNRHAYIHYSNICTYIFGLNPLWGVYTQYCAKV